MIKLLINTTTTADTNLSASTFYQLLKFVITNVSSSYVMCGFIIVMCMFATTLRNLIYKVLNLAIMSVFVVALWAYMTDVTFIYIVYILAFVSAVVMLFLSVVLMLPSSAIAVNKRNLSLTLLSALDTSDASGLGNALGIAKSCLVLAVVYFILSFIKAWKYSHSTNLSAHLVSKPNYYMAWVVYRIRWAVANFIGYAKNYCISGKWTTDYSLEDRYAYDAQWQRDNASLKSNKAALIKMPGFIPVYIAQSISKAVAYFSKHVVNCRGYVLYFFSKVIVVSYHDFIHTFKLYAPLVTMLAADRNTRLSRRFIFTATYNALFIVGPVNNRFSFIRNFIVFSGADLLSALVNIVVCAAVFLVAPANVELAAQAITTLSIFFIALPVGLTGGWLSFTYSSYLVDAGASKFVENLAAIQQGLYVQQPLLLLVSITGLLVALIGAPFFVSRNK